jgi:hypothetical protein
MNEKTISMQINSFKEMYMAKLQGLMSLEEQLAMHYKGVRESVT